MDGKQGQMSAFAAYNVSALSPVIKSPVTKAKAKRTRPTNSSILELSHGSLMSRLISKKKENFKHISDECGLIGTNVAKNKSKRNITESNLTNGVLPKKTKRNQAKNAKQNNEPNEPLNNFNGCIYDDNIIQSTPLPKVQLTNKIRKEEVIKCPLDDESHIIETDSRAYSSIDAGKELFAWVIQPTSVTDFISSAWEKAPLLIERKCPTYYSKLLSMKMFDKMLRDHRIEFTKNLDVTSYVNGERKTHNLEGRAMPPTVWDFYQQGCSIRLLNPQTFLPVIHSMNATLQEYFQCMTGANVYLTPANSQGFAPHYDDIEAFVLQIEGKKHWKVYKPRTSSEELPRESSHNFSQSEIGKPILDVILNAGDMLYFPRGFIHQATTVKDHHSMHITLSTYQKNAFADLIEILLPSMIQSSVMKGKSPLRRGLPMNIWQCMGLVYSDEDDTNSSAFKNRATIKLQLKECLNLVMKSFDEHIDDAVDQLAVKFQHDALPPHLTSGERRRSVYGTEDMTNVSTTPLPDQNTLLRLTRANILRLVRSGPEELRIYYSADNTRQYHEQDETFAEIGAEEAPAIEYLIKSYPSYTTPSEWPIDDTDQCVAVAQDLWERGLLLSQSVVQ